MKTDKIKILLDRFYDAETSMEEERTLHAYFAGENISPELEQEKQPFLQLFATEKTIVPPTLEKKLTILIDDLASKEEKAVRDEKNKKRKLWFYTASIAASIALLISVGIYINNGSEGVPVLIEKSNDYVARDTYSDPEKARIEAEKALQLMAANLNKGMDQLSQVSASMDKTNEIIDRSLNKINN